MEAKDTVMSDEEIKEVLRKTYGFGIEIRKGDFGIAKAQAEITWVAREPEIEKARKAGKQEGIKEVVEWLTSKQRINADNSVFWITESLRDWQAKLKEWGVE